MQATIIWEKNFCTLVVNIWNSLPDSVVDADTINTFKTRLYKHWRHQDVVNNFYSGTERSYDVVNDTGREEDRSLLYTRVGELATADTGTCLFW